MSASSRPGSSRASYPGGRKTGETIGRASVGELLLALRRCWKNFWHRLEVASVRRRLKACGPGLQVQLGARFEGLEQISLGRGVGVSEGCKILAQGPSAEVVLGNNVACNHNVFVCAGDGERITIGNNVLIGPNVVMRSADHAFDDPAAPILNQNHVSGDITVGDDVWVAANVVITAGVTIGQGAVVAAGAVVTRDVEPGHVVGGVPARVLRKRGERDSPTSGPQ